MFARASIAVATGSDLVVERAVDLVLLRAEDGREIIGHGVAGGSFIASRLEY